MSGFYAQYLYALCKRRGWSEPIYEYCKDHYGYTCIVQVNGREYQTDVAYESTDLAHENAAMRAFMVCRNFSVNGGMLARNGIVQGLPADESTHKQSMSSGRYSSSAAAALYHTSRSHDQRSRPTQGSTPLDHYSGSIASHESTTLASSAFGSIDSASSNTSVKSSHTDDDLPARTSSRVPSEVPALWRKALMSKSGLATKHVDSRQAIEAYRQSLEEYSQTSASPHDITRALNARDYNKTQWLLERFFDQVAVREYTWLAELAQLGLSHLEITDELLEKAIQGSWIHEPFEDPHSEGFTPGLHQSNCVHTGHPVNSVDSLHRPLQDKNIIVSGLGDNNSHHGSHEFRDDMKSPLMSERDSHEVILTARQRIEYYCGLGGVRPAADGSTDIEFGAVCFEDNNSRASITLNGPADNSTMIEVLDNLARAAGELQRIGGCCDSFSVLVESVSDDFVELHRVPFETIHEFRKLVLGHKISDLDECVTDFFVDLFGPADFIIPMTGEGSSRQHWFLVATQFLALGLLSYTQAHCGPIKPFFLDAPLQALYLLGSGNPESELKPPLTLGCYLVNLTCMGDMTGQPFLVFGRVPSLPGHEEPLTPSARRKDMFASPVDILDTWGPGLMVTSANDSKVLHSIVVGGGTITSTADSTDPSTLPWLHWTRQDVYSPTATGSFLRDVKTFIGRTILENNGCQAAAARLKNSLPLLEEIGTFPSYWELMERQLGLGIQGGQAAVAILQFNQTWVKMMGTTKKSAMLSQRSVYISDLDNMFGVQVSICTGIARRVRVRDLLVDLLPAYVSGLVVEPLQWKDLVGKYNLLGALRESDLRCWLESLDHPCRVEFEGLVFAVLYLLRDTGIDRKGDYFVIACVQRDLPFQCFKIPCKNENYWARMLIDSEDSATFAYVTTQCLETAALKCCRPSPSWFNSTALLGTAVSEDRVAVAYAPVAAPAVGQWTLKENEAYLIGHPDRILSVQVKTPNGLDPHLLVSLSTIPPEFLKRLFRKGKPKRLKERKCFDSCAESVIICVEKMGISVLS